MTRDFCALLTHLSYSTCTWNRKIGFVDRCMMLLVYGMEEHGSTVTILIVHSCQLIGVVYILHPYLCICWNEFDLSLPRFYGYVVDDTFVFERIKWMAFSMFFLASIICDSNFTNSRLLKTPRSYVLFEMPHRFYQRLPQMEPIAMTMTLPSQT